MSCWGGGVVRWYPALPPVAVSLMLSSSRIAVVYASFLERILVLACTMSPAAGEPRSQDVADVACEHIYVLLCLIIRGAHGGRDSPEVPHVRIGFGPGRWRGAALRTVGVRERRWPFLVAARRP